MPSAKNKKLRLLTPKDKLISDTNKGHSPGTKMQEEDKKSELSNWSDKVK